MTSVVGVGAVVDQNKVRKALCRLGDSLRWELQPKQRQQGQKACGVGGRLLYTGINQMRENIKDNGRQVSYNWRRKLQP